ncbi:hypothetical protein NQ317_012348 [Molorchus minor]|uniref:Fibrinogen C-terminal domain-containing protein n=1 Tax=Molorchus minor TaxID=1323400 RepID=A0ABQ9J687_9CUCU|nr:hypothetical protein NQ317_012348 [Molorchus minor]
MRSASRKMEQYLFNVFEAIISTLESKLQRIENLDKAVEHLMRRVENLDTQVNNNIDKTESVIDKLRNIDSKLFTSANRLPYEINKKSDAFADADTISVNKKLVTLDKKVSDIDDKLNVLKNQLDSNYLQADDINAEASEKRSVSMNVMEITKALNTDVINHVTKELGQLREKNLGKVLNMMTDVHHAIIDDPSTYKSHGYYNRTTTTTTQKPEPSRTSKIDSLVQQMKPIISVSEKMDEVWDVVGEIHSDLRTKTNKIIANLDKVEKRLKKQEDDVATLAQRPVPAEILLDPTIDSSEFESTRYLDEFATDTTLPVGFSTLPPPVVHTQISVQNSTSLSSTTEKRAEKRKGGIIFPSVKNKPTPLNSTFVTASDAATSIKDVKYSAGSSGVKNIFHIENKTESRLTIRGAEEADHVNINFPQIKPPITIISHPIFLIAFSHKECQIDTMRTLLIYHFDRRLYGGYSCVDLLNAGMRNSGIYYLQIRGTTYWFLKVYCEQEIAEGGWTVSNHYTGLA